MKKISLFLIFLITFLFLVPVNNSAAADGNAEIVLRIVSDDVYFYRNYDFKENSKMFLLTKTYFIIGIDCGDYYSVQYKKDTTAEIRGYVKKSEVEVYDDGIPTLIYPEYKATTTNYLTFYDIKTYKPCFSDDIETLDCYGKNTNENKFYMLINYEGFGYNGPYYVNCNLLDVTEPRVHPIPLKVVSAETNPGTEKNEVVKPPNNDETIQIIIILIIIVFAVAVVYFVFRPNNYKYKKNDKE